MCRDKLAGYLRHRVLLNDTEACHRCEEHSFLVVLIVLTLLGVNKLVLCVMSRVKASTVRC